MSTVTFTVKYENEIQPMEFCANTGDLHLIGDSNSGISFLTKDEIIQHLDSALIDGDKEDLLADYAQDKTILWHFSLGMWIRNTYGFWLPNNPIDTHPDDVSMTIINEYCKHILNSSNEQHETVSQFDSAMKVLD